MKVDLELLLEHPTDIVDPSLLDPSNVESMPPTTFTAESATEHDTESAVKLKLLKESTKKTDTADTRINTDLSIRLE